ncbi:MAG: HAMP domain-containing sensor histidine kinase [Rhodospirillaceae bacterium]|nr:HAMP domain-containing sensor histidine kinase [Rhodospirillaceae bacterium]
MKLARLLRLPHRINLIWVLMLIPLAAVSVFSGVAIVRLADMKDVFTAHWQFHETPEMLDRLLSQARQAHVLLNESANPVHAADFDGRISDFAVRLAALKTHRLLRNLDHEFGAATRAAADYRAAVADAARVHERIDRNGLPDRMIQLRSDSERALDPAFFEATNQIIDIQQLFGCQSRLEASRQFRDDVEVLRGRIEALDLPLNDKIRIQNNINEIRGRFGDLLLACQDLERAGAAAGTAYVATRDAVETLLAGIDQQISADLDAFVDNQTTTLVGLSGVVLLVFLAGFAATLTFSNRFGRQLKAMIESIRAIAAGQRATKVPFIESTDEFGEIARNVEQFRINSIKLEEALIAARHANDAKTQFLATVSHELRTPLNAILGFSEIIRDGLVGDVSPTYREYARDIYVSGQALLEQISMILDLSKIELGRLDVETAAVDLTGVVGIALRRLERKIGEKKLRIDWAPPRVQTVTFDRGHLLQIVTNILDNAVKYNREGGSIALSVVADGDRVLLSVRDTGIGMHDHEVARAEQPFVQFGGSQDSLQGVGLGLSIVSRLVNANGATLHIASRKNVGTTVTIGMPRAAAVRSVA